MGPDGGLNFGGLNPVVLTTPPRHRQRLRMGLQRRHADAEIFWDEVVALDPAMESKDERHMKLSRVSKRLLGDRGDGPFVLKVQAWCVRGEVPKGARS